MISLKAFTKISEREKIKNHWIEINPRKKNYKRQLNNFYIEHLNGLIVLVSIFPLLSLSHPHPLTHSFDRSICVCLVHFEMEMQRKRSLQHWKMQT